MEERPHTTETVDTLVPPREGKDDAVAQQLREAREQFIRLWGQMGSAWGIPRIMAEVHALLFIVGEPQNADDVVDFLQISRGSASTALRGLVEWGVVRKLHQPRERKEYFEAEQDVWTLFRTILRERKKREVDPVIVELHRTRRLTESLDVDSNDTQTTNAISGHNERLDDMLKVMEMLDQIARRVASPTGVGIQKAAGLLFKGWPSGGASS